ncbi:hypothetical protein B0H66DRAFT_551507 [Apodospora peruviana]|uniref:Wax synthase domain-containing protein n=1 Tax=Apodospora peruviana TaxID=516989 RepID=A0AAE0MBT9_9PEZI|nr:hypothetical protein B0H66DRAFT_551507 [Apodospora peruviana]
MPSLHAIYSINNKITIFKTIDAMIFPTITTTAAKQNLSLLWPHILAPTTFLLLFSIPPFAPRQPLYLTAIISLFYLCFFSSDNNLNSHIRLALALPWMFYLDWATKMVLHHLPEHDFWPVTASDAQINGNIKKFRRQSTGNGHHHQPQSPPIPQGWKPRLAWAIGLLSSPRGVGWNFQLSTPDLPPETKNAAMGRWRFVIRQTCRVVGFIVLSELISATMMMMQLLMTENECSKSQDHYDFSWGNGLMEMVGAWMTSWNWRRTLLVPLVAMKRWSDLEAQYAGLNAVYVGAGLVEVKVCRPLFGDDLTSLDSLREFWGQFWPQSSRRMFQDFGRTACRILRIHPHSELSWHVHIWVAFIIAGLVHGFAFGYALSGNGDADGVLNKNFRAILTFFILQAVGLSVETLFLDTPVKDLTLYESGLQDEMMMGRIWTWGWLLFTGHYALDSWLQVAAADKPRLLPALVGLLSTTNQSRLGRYLAGDGGLLEL